MIIPISHEDQTVDRIPWVSITIMGLCLLIHIFITVEMKRAVNQVGTAALNMFKFYFERTYLKLDPEVKRIFALDEKFEEAIKQMEKNNNNPFALSREKPADYAIEEEQEELDRLSKQLLAIMKKMPYYRFGFIPADKSFFGLLSYMFIHGGWLHLLGNLYLFYLCAPFIEDKWGKPVFLATYLLAGMFGAIMFSVHYPNFSGPLIGASGALAGIMGAFLVKFWNTKIKFFYWFFFIIVGTFRAPAWVILPLWVGFEFFNANAMDALKLPGGGGVAHWVHVWGFVFGVGVALGLKYLGIEEKYLAPKIKAKVSFKDEGFKSFEEAEHLLEKGRKNQAFEVLLNGAEKHPDQLEIIELLWNLGIEMDRKDEAVKSFKRMIESEMRQKNFELATFHYGQLKEHFPEKEINDQARLYFLDFLITTKDYKEAESLTGEFIQKIQANPLNVTPGFLLEMINIINRLEFALLGKRKGPPLVDEIIKLAIEHPDMPDFRKNELKTKVKLTPTTEQTAKTDILKEDTLSILLDESPETVTAPAVVSGAGATEGGTGMGTASSAAMAGQQDDMDGSSTRPLHKQKTTYKTAPVPIPPGDLATKIKPPSPPHQVGVAPPSIPTAPPPPPSLPEESQYMELPVQIPPSPAETTQTVKLESRLEKTQIAPSQLPPSAVTAAHPSSTPPRPQVPQSPASPSVHRSSPQSSPSPSPKTITEAKTISVTQAIPVGFTERKIILEIKDIGQRVYALEKIQAICVVKILVQAKKPFYLIDLLVDDPLGTASNIRTIRMFTPQIDWQLFFPDAPSLGEAFKMFMMTLLQLSGAKPFPDLESVQLQKVISFQTVADYEKSLASQ